MQKYKADLCLHNKMLDQFLFLLMLIWKLRLGLHPYPAFALLVCFYFATAIDLLNSKHHYYMCVRDRRDKSSIAWGDDES